MVRRSAVLLALLLVTMVPTRTEATHTPTDSCVALGTMRTSQPLRWSATGPAVTANFSISLFVGLCVVEPALAMQGTLTGGCDLLSGQGITNHGHLFTFIGVGARLFFTGEVTGEVPFLPDTVAGHSCTTGAQQFLVGYSGAVMRECTGTFHQQGTLTTVGAMPVRYHLCA